MKIRLGFVSNSSSSSFAIPLDKISKEQVDSLKYFWRDEKCRFAYNPLSHSVQIAYADGLDKQIFDFCCGTISIPWDMWRIREEDSILIGECKDDSGYDMKEYIQNLGIDLEDVNYKRVD